MEENKNFDATPAVQEVEEEKSSIDFAAIYTALILNWKWFLVSLIICLGVAVIYLRYTTPIYRASAKLLIKDDDQSKMGGRNTALNTSTLGMISNSNGVDNELEILSSRSIAAQAVRDLKLYVTYTRKGRLKEVILYKNQPITVDVDPGHLETLNAPINLVIKRENGKYHVTGTYYVNGQANSVTGPYSLDKTLGSLPATIGTRAGFITFAANTSTPMDEGSEMKVQIVSPDQAAYKYEAELTASQTNKNTSIVLLALSDEVPQRAMDYLKQLTIAYNQQANADKNEVATNTEAFINSRLEKINAELGSTESQLENYKKRNNMVELKLNAGQAVANADTYDQKLADANTQIDLLQSLQEY
ncbi:MAG: Wzz/FepE/Etk N-terminal domain-containing protein, partial [Prevotella sp.]